MRQVEAVDGRCQHIHDDKAVIHIVHKAIPSDGCKDAIFLHKAEEGKGHGE